MRNNYQIERSEDSVSKISRSKSKNQVSITAKLKQKESKWNERFHLQHIPEYNYQNQPHSQYLKNKFRVPNRKNDPSRAKKNVQPSLQKNKVSNKPNPRKNQERIKEAINKAFSDLKTLWYQKSIPACHMELMTKMFNRQNYPMKILQDIKHQFSQILKDISLVQKVVTSISTRQACVQKIHQIIKQFQTGQLNQAKVCKVFEQKVAHLRILTIHCIQCIYQWKQSMETILQKKSKPIYLHEGKSYLQKITQDFHKIINSKINQVYYFQDKKPDPFFLNYTLEGKKISNVSKNLIKRIRLCQIMLTEDEQKQQESKRTPLVQKVKIPPSMKDKSMPSREKIELSQSFVKLSIQYSQFADYFAKLLQKSGFGKSFFPQVQMGKFEQITIFQATQTGDQIAFASDRFSSQRKIIILGLKSNNQNVESVCRSFCEYLWEHDSCLQIRVSLVHHMIGENLGIDGELQKGIKGVGFRWVSVNNRDDIRMTVFAIKRPLDTVAHKTARRKQAYPVIIQHLTGFSLQENNDKKIPSQSQMCVMSIIDLLRQLKKQQYEQVCRRDEYFSYLQSLKKIQTYLEKEAARQNITQGFETSFQYSGLKAFQIENQDKIEKIFRTLQISPKILNSAIFPQFISLFNTSFKFGSTIINDGKFTKFFPSKQNQILICESNYPIYILPSDEQSINFFIIQVDEPFSMHQIDTIFHAMGHQSSFIDEFWLPNFYKTADYSDQVGLKNSQLISTDYRTCLGSLTRKSRVRTKVVKPPFVFGMIHKKLLQMLEIPLYCTLIGKQHIL